jgi:hypothetical protein
VQRQTSELSPAKKGFIPEVSDCRELFSWFGPEKRKGTRIAKPLFEKKLVLPAT